MRILAMLIVALCAAGTASAAPEVGPSSTGQDWFSVPITFDSSTAESAAIGTGGLCSIGFVYGGSGTVQVYQVPTESTPATSGTQVGLDFDATLSEARSGIKPGQPFFKVIAPSASPGSRMRIHCSNIQLSEVSGGGSSSAGPPASGDDSSVTFYENSDHDGNVIRRVLDADVDLPANKDSYYGPLGTLEDRWVTTHVDDSGIDSEQEIIRWFANSLNGAGGAHLTHSSTSLANSYLTISSQSGGRANLDQITVRIMSAPNNATANNCRIEAMWQSKDESGSFVNFEPTATGAATGWTVCGGAVDMGPASANTGGYGTTSALDRPGEFYTINTTGCTCDTYFCMHAVKVSDISDGVNECTAISDVRVGAHVVAVHTP